MKLHLDREAHGRLGFQEDKYFSSFTGSKNPTVRSIAVGGRGEFSAGFVCLQICSSSMQKVETPVGGCGGFPK